MKPPRKRSRNRSDNGSAHQCLTWMAWNAVWVTDQAVVEASRHGGSNVWAALSATGPEGPLSKGASWGSVEKVLTHTMTFYAGMGVERMPCWRNKRPATIDWMFWICVYRFHDRKYKSEWLESAIFGYRNMLSWWTWSMSRSHQRHHHFFPTSLCGVLVFGSVPRRLLLLPPPPPPAAHLSSHNLLTHNLPTHNLLTHNLQLAHTQLDLSSHNLSSQLAHTQLAHTQLVITQLVITQLVITQLVFTQLAHTQLIHTQRYWHFAWQAWHLVTWIVTLRGRRGTYGTGLALVARLGRSGRDGRRGFLRGRRGTFETSILLSRGRCSFSWHT